MSTTADIYTIPLPAHQRAAVENLAQLVTNGDELALNAEDFALLRVEVPSLQ